MAIYYFNIRCAGRVDFDSVGVEFRNDTAAREGAIEAAKDMIEDVLAGEGVVGPKEIEVVTATGEWIATVPLREVLDRPVGESDRAIGASGHEK